MPIVTLLKLTSYRKKGVCGVMHYFYFIGVSAQRVSDIIISCLMYFAMFVVFIVLYSRDGP